MDLETENRIASVLMKEAAELRRQADKEGVHVYLRERNVRFRPNSRFLTATVLGVQQANRVAEVNELWRLRKKEQELDDRLKGSSKNKRSYTTNHSNSPRRTSSRHIEHNDTLRSSSSGQREQNGNFQASSKSQVGGSYSDEDEVDGSYSSDGGLKDDEVQQFLHSRVKRGRGGVGARMDEPGPYLPRTGSDSKGRLSESLDVREGEEWECCVMGPEKPPSFRSNRSLEVVNEDNWKKAKKPKLESPSPKKRSKIHRRKEGKHGSKERKERKSKHRRRRTH